MFEKLTNALTSQKDETSLKKDAIANLLHTNPDALAAFEEAYAKSALEETPENFFDVNSRQAAAMNHAKQPAVTEDVKELQERIVNELLAQTTAFVFDGKLGRVKEPQKLLPGATMVSAQEVGNLPIELRPQLTGELMKVDVGQKSYPHLMYFYDQFLHGKNEKTRQFAYNHFRQGLDILDLDAITYEIIGTNRNSMGHWFPQLIEACRGQEFFKIPATTIVKVPLTLLQLTRQEYGELTPTTIGIVDQWAHKAFDLNDEKEYFIKTGTYSSKFDFRNAHVHGAKEVQELGEYLLFIHTQALQMASPLCHPCIYGVSTTNEWVAREFIEDKEKNPCIYKGLPLHTEYRVFVDCDTDQVIGISPYWEPNTMKQRFGHEADADSPHQMHDYVVYKAHEETLMQRYQENKDSVLAQIQNILPELNLKGQWSVDVMQNGDDFWIIDMALAEMSTFYDCVPKELRSPSKEDWMPRLPE